MMEIGKLHIPVMQAEVIDALAPAKAGRYLDGTLGLGGHAAAILARAPSSRLCGLDQDAQALELARQRLAQYGDRVHFFHARFAGFPAALRELGWDNLNGALLDLGVSSLQLDTPGRGFSFRERGPLDMRMDRDSGEKGAWHIVNRGSFADLRDCFATLGEEPQAGRIARKIIEERQKEAIEDTERFAAIVRAAYPPAWRRSARNHPATRVFQALRMAVNDECGQLGKFLELVPDWLAPGARVAILSFHSIEDRMVKRAMRRWTAERDDIRILLKRPLVPSEQEKAANPRSGSAKLRVAEKI